MVFGNQVRCYAVLSVSLHSSQIKDIPDVHQGIYPRSVDAQVLLTAVRLKHVIQASLEPVLTTHVLDQRAHVVRHVERIFKGRRFVRNRLPRTIATLGWVVTARIERAVGQSGRQEARERWRRIHALNIVVPTQLPPS